MIVRVITDDSLATDINIYREKKITYGWSRGNNGN